MISVNRKHGTFEIVYPKAAAGKELLEISANFGFLLPWNCKDVSGDVFADIILANCGAPQAEAVARALRAV